MKNNKIMCSSTLIDEVDKSINIFKEANFGDMYKTKGGLRAVYNYQNTTTGKHILLVEKIGDMPYTDDGTLLSIERGNEYKYDADCSLNIVSRYEHK